MALISTWLRTGMLPGTQINSAWPSLRGP